MRLRITVAVALLASAVTCAVFAYGYLDCRSRTLTADIRTALQAEEPRLYEDALAVCDRWEGCERLFCVLIHHNDADALSRSFFLLRQYASERKPEETRAALCGCLADLTVLMKGETPDFTNFL